MIVAGGTVVLNLILSAMAGYPLARMEFNGKKITFFAGTCNYYDSFSGYHASCLLNNNKTSFGR